jgi:hypothetical protein
MAATTMRTHNDYFLYCVIPDVSSATATDNAAYVAVPDKGKLIKVFSTIDAAITVADAELTITCGSQSAVTQTITIAQSGAAAGDVDYCVPADNNIVAEGDVIKIASDGGSTTQAAANITLVIRR